eukprot:scaffold263696_cov25-Tisochrysis_lutea.AAC.1
MSADLKQAHSGCAPLSPRERLSRKRRSCWPPAGLLEPEHQLEKPRMSTANWPGTYPMKRLPTPRRGQLHAQPRAQRAFRPVRSHRARAISPGGSPIVNVEAGELRGRAATYVSSTADQEHYQTM